MPLSIQIPYRGDQYLFQGISGAGASIGEGMEQMMKRMKQTKAVRNMAVDGLGMDPDAVDKMSLEEVQGHLQGAALKNAQQEAQARRMMETAHASYYNRFNQKADAEDRFSAAVSQYMQPPIPNTGNPLQQMPTGDMATDMMSGGDPTGMMQRATMPRTLDPQALMRLEAQSGTLNPEKALQYMKALDERRVNWEDVRPHDFTTADGTRGVYGKGGQFQFDPSQFMSKGGEADSITDENGNVIGYMPPGGKGSPIKPPTAKPLPPTFYSAMDKVGADIAGAQSSLDVDDSTFADAAIAAKSKAAAKSRLSTAQKQGKSIIDRYHSSGLLKDDVRDNMYQDLGLTPPAAAKPVASKAAGARVTVADKTGKKFTVPKEQLDEAVSKGYTEVK